MRICASGVGDRTDGREGAWPRATASWTVLLALALGAWLTVAAPARADTATISVLTTTGASDPVADVPRVVAISGTAALPTRVWVKYRAPGGAPCAPSAYSDSGSNLYGDGGSIYFYGTSVNGAFRLQAVDTWARAGDYVFCIWLASDDESIATPITQLITFRGAVGTISATVSPATPLPNQRTTITVSGSTETPAEVYATLRGAGGASCAPSASSDSGTSLMSGADVNGAFSLTADTRQAAGTYLVCVWLVESADGSTLVAGPQSATFTVAAPAPPPPPPCVVPGLGRVRAVATVKGRIRAGNCRVGRTIRVHSRKPRGRVLRLLPRSGRQLAHRARVDLIVSRGRRLHRR